jgi:hypothetical protein
MLTNRAEQSSEWEPAFLSSHSADATAHAREQSNLRGSIPGECVRGMAESLEERLSFRIKLILCLAVEFQGPLANITGAGINGIGTDGEGGANVDFKLLIWGTMDAFALGVKNLTVLIVGPDGEVVDRGNIVLNGPGVDAHAVHVHDIKRFLPFGTYSIRALVNGKTVDAIPLAVVHQKRPPAHGRPE